MNTCKSGRWLCVVAVGVLLTTMAHADWKFSGYTQVRYNIWDSDYGSKKPDSDFLLRRIRIKLEGPVAPDTTITVQADLAGLVDNESTTGPIPPPMAYAVHVNP